MSLTPLMFDPGNASGKEIALDATAKILFPGMMAWGLKSETGKFITVMKYGDSLFELDDGGKAAMDAFDQLNPDKKTKLNVGEYVHVDLANHLDEFKELSDKMNEVKLQDPKALSMLENKTLTQNIPYFENEYLSIIEKNPELKGKSYSEISKTLDEKSLNKFNKQLNSIKIDIPDNIKIDASKLSEKIGSSNLINGKSAKAISNLEGLKMGKLAKDTAMMGAFAGGISASMQLAATGTIDPEQLSLDVGGAVVGEFAEKGVTKSIEKIGKAIGSKGASIGASAVKGGAMGAKVGKTAVVAAKAGKTAGTAIAKSLGQKAVLAAGGPVGLAVAAVWMAVDITSMTLDLADVCGYNTKEMYKSDVQNVYNTYLESYKDIFKDIGIEYPFEVKPDLNKPHHEVEYFKYFTQYIDDCNLTLTQEVIEEELKQKKIKRRRMIRNKNTGIASAAFLVMDNTVNYLLLLLLAIVVKKRKEKDKLLIDEIEKNSKVPFYKTPLFINLTRVGIFAILGLILFYDEIISLINYIIDLF